MTFSVLVYFLLDKNCQLAHKQKSSSLILLLLDLWFFIGQLIILHWCLKSKLYKTSLLQAVSDSAKQERKYSFTGTCNSWGSRMWFIV